MCAERHRLAWGLCYLYPCQSAYDMGTFNFANNQVSSLTGSQRVYARATFHIFSTEDHDVQVELMHDPHNHIDGPYFVDYLNSNLQFWNYASYAVIWTAVLYFEALKRIMPDAKTADLITETVANISMREKFYRTNQLLLRPHIQAGKFQKDPYIDLIVDPTTDPPFAPWINKCEMPGGRKSYLYELYLLNAFCDNLLTLYPTGKQLLCEAFTMLVQQDEEKQNLYYLDRAYWEAYKAVTKVAMNILVKT
jgi:hypothetical protein